MELDATQEKRRAPRAVVDIDGQLAVGGATLLGTIHDLSFTGSLFITEDLLNIATGASAVLTFVLPNSTAWFKPQVEVRRTSTFQRLFGQSAQAVGFAFSGLALSEERAIALACYEWASCSSRAYALAAECFAQGLDGIQNFSRFGRLLEGSRDALALRFPSKELPLQPRHLLRLKVGQATTLARVLRLNETRLGTEVGLRMEGWGRDFFLHQARFAA